MTDVKFIDTSNWQILRGLSSGGTREKRVLQDDSGAKWYFKRSERKPGRPGQPEKYYKYEFWSEIIAYQLGHSLGLDILRYDVGVSAGDIGCISQEMDAAADEQLVEVGRYMTTYNPAFDPDNTKARKEYTFQLLEEAIGHFELRKYWPIFLTTLVFDAVIGNTDRHQENWAFVGVAYRNLGAAMESMGENKAERLRNLMRAMSDAAVADVDNYVRLLNEFQLITIDLKRMAPIYDSGSSLAREINEERVLQLLKDENELRKYIERGSAEVHWLRQKTSHFQLLENILTTKHADTLRAAAFFLHNWIQHDVEQLINHIDDCIPDEHAEYKIPLERKNLMVKLLTLRHRRVVDIIYG